jgi:hypothetical protein
MHLEHSRSTVKYARLHLLLCHHLNIPLRYGYLAGHENNLLNQHYSLDTLDLPRDMFGGKES